MAFDCIKWPYNASSCVLFFRRFLNFFFSHIILIESYVNKLKHSVDEALKKSSKLVIHIVSFTKELLVNCQLS